MAAHSLGSDVSTIFSFFDLRTRRFLLARDRRERVIRNDAFDLTNLRSALQVLSLVQGPKVRFNTLDTRLHQRFVMVLNLLLERKPRVAHHGAISYSIGLGS
jgi:hypothetical protein